MRSLAVEVLNLWEKTLMRPEQPWKHLLEEARLSIEPERDLCKLEMRGGGLALKINLIWSETTRATEEAGESRRRTT
uniref:Uncharacterized protein n=1 Tax=Cannabis sativa TaxID=3483 RepID=A0A803NWV5_CANSA